MEKSEKYLHAELIEEIVKIIGGKSLEVFKLTFSWWVEERIFPDLYKECWKQMSADQGHDSLVDKNMAGKWKPFCFSFFGGG